MAQGNGITYIRAFQAEARQLNSMKAGFAFFRLGVPLGEAVEWANAGYTPDEVAILSGLGLHSLADARQFEDDEIFAALLNRS